MGEYPVIGWTGVGYSLLLIALVLGMSWLLKLALGRKLLIGCLRTIIQLSAVGYILGYIFGAGSPWLVLLAASVQYGLAVWTAGSLQERRIRGCRTIAAIALLPPYLLVMAVLLLIVVQPNPWWDPKIVLTLGGMLLGNSLTAVALALNRYVAEVANQRELVLARLALAAPWALAVEDARLAAAHAAVLPAISSLLTVGIVAMPGMMTGQIIAGLDPINAVQYQIVVMFMIAAAVAMAVGISLVLITRAGQFEPETSQSSS